MHAAVNEIAIEQFRLRRDGVDIRHHEVGRLGFAGGDHAPGVQATQRIDLLRMNDRFGNLRIR